MTTDISVGPRWGTAVAQHGEVEDYEYDGGNSSSRLFERSRIKALADERESVQKKTFTKWVNSHLIRANSRIDDLYLDLRDGKILLKLLEILSGERLPKPTKGKMRIHCLENVDKAIQFLLREQRVHLENMGSHDVVDGNSRLTLGLIWTIILRFQIQDIMVEEVDNKEVKSAKDALLLWCQMKTAGYNSVNIRNFTSSWRDGLAFNAIIHKHRPDLIQYDKLSKSNPIHNLNNAFNVAERDLGLAKLLDAEDVFTDNPDEKSIITYVVTYYHYFSKMKAETVQGRRIAKVVGEAMDIDRMISDYDKMTSDLLKWIEKKIEELSDRQFANSLQGVQQQLAQFNSYRMAEKPTKFEEKSNLEMLLFSLQSKMRANNQKAYVPSEGKMISDVNRAWEHLEKAEHERELALREELIRQEKLEQLAARFDRKAGMRETWLSENQRLVSQDNFGSDLPAVEAAAKKHEAIETDIFAYEERVQAVVAVAQELEAENYHDIYRINARKDNVLRLWSHLLELLRNRRSRLESCMSVQKTFQEMLYIEDSINILKQSVLSEDYGKHLMGVVDLLHKHTLLEGDIGVVGERVRNITQVAQGFIEEDPAKYQPCSPELVHGKIGHLEKTYTELTRLADLRKRRLEESKKLWQFYWNMAEEEAYIREKEHILSSGEIGHDLTTVHLLISKNKALEEELAAHEPQLISILQSGHDLLQDGHFGSENIQKRLKEVEELWDKLKELQAMRSARLDEAIQYHQFFTDADDVDAWMYDTLKLVSSEDVGYDEPHAQSLLKKHDEAAEELKEHEKTIEALKQQANSLGEEDRKAPEVIDRLSTMNAKYGQLQDKANQRRARLQDAISLYKLLTEVDGVEQWISEKEKMIDSMSLSRDMEDIEVMKHRFETFEQEMNANASRVAVVNQIARRLLHVDHPSSQQIINQQNQLNERWAELRDKSEKKREQIDSAHGVQTYHIECRETISWIEEKTKLLQATEELGDDLTGIMTLQRRLGGMERDLAAIKTKLDVLEEESLKIREEHPEETSRIDEKATQIRNVWERLTQLLKEKDAKLEEAGDLHRFLRDLDHFQAWLTKTQTDVASEDTPMTLSEAEKLLAQHKQIKEEIDNYTEDYNSMMEYGEKVTHGQTDSQYIFLRERLRALKDGWTELHQMWENRQQFLSQNLNLQVFYRDAKQAEVLLSKQENYLSKDETPASLEQAEELCKKHDAFETTMDANDEKINAVINCAHTLTEDGILNADKVKKKAEDIDARRRSNRQKAEQYGNKLTDQLKTHQFLQECEQLSDWIQEKYITAQDDSYRSAKTIHSKWTRHQAFESEIASNKDRLVDVREAGQELAQEIPELRGVIQSKLEGLEEQFEQLETTTKEKGQKLFEAKGEQLLDQGLGELDNWLTELESQVLTSEPANDLITVRKDIDRQETMRKHYETYSQNLDQLHQGVGRLEQIDPQKQESIKIRKEMVTDRFEKLRGPLEQRAQQLMKKKDAFQLRRDIEDEKLWIKEKEPVATSTEYGNSLFGVQMLIKKHHSLQTEIDNHEPRIISICESGRRIISEGNEDSAEFKQLIDEIMVLWGDLKKKMDHRRSKLLESQRAQQYYFDASEAEAWMSEQELYMMVEDRGKDEFSTQNLMKKHDSLESAVGDYAETVKSLGETAKQLIEEKHPQSDQIIIRQSQIDKLYAGLKDLANERRGKLNEALELYSLGREFDDVMQWIQEREVIAGSHELGQDFDHVTLLRERFKVFSKDSETLGRERVSVVNESADALINAGHSDAAIIAEWKDNLNEAWDDLQELIATRDQMLVASWERMKFFHDCKDVLARIQEKHHALPDELGRDAKSVSNLQRKHANFEHDLQTLRSAVQTIQEDSDKLQAMYAGEHARDIINRETDVMNAWRQLITKCDARRGKLADTNDLLKFFMMVRDLIAWMEDVVRQMNASEKPRDVSGVELLMNNHQNLKGEIDARKDNFEACISLGRELTERNHYASDDIRDKLFALTNQRGAMMRRWDERWDHLQLILEVYQFARDAAVAEAWLVAQEPYLLSRELGHTIDEVEQLIKKHEAFEKSTAAQEERFAALERLTMFEMKEMEKKEQEKLAKQRRDLARQKSPSPDEPPSDKYDGEGDISERSGGPASEGRSESEAKERAGTSMIKIEGNVIVEGILNRKHVWESTTRRASNRSWEKGLYTVLRGTHLCVYKDGKHFKQEPDRFLRGERPVDLTQAVAEIPADYTKRKNVFRLKLTDGGEFLFEAPNTEEMNAWIGKISQCNREPKVSSPTRAQTLPAKAEALVKEEHKKRGFFTMKKGK
ncbi:spectrin beta chain-like isoform X2 [Brevipalpus obovatus]|uniref:spectrin beta chain-like isoform X2 n=1 Tax=Brevipalpus obovatus TaxID=246614 RepID=UPI003D9F160E